MFERVDLPAPFSPSRACTSPSAASKSTRSLARTPGNRFVMPVSETAAAIARGLRRGAGAPPHVTLLALRAPDDALDEPVHRVQLLDRQALALRHAQLAALVVERAGELVERAALERSLLGGDLGLRRGRHLRAVGREADETVLERAVVEAR